MTAGLLLDYANEAVFALAVLAILIHTLAEMGAVGKPFWRYYGEHFVLVVLDATGFALFVALGAALIAAAHLGLIAGNPFFAWVLVGLFLADWALSHVGLRLLCRGENPGLVSSFFYLPVCGLIALLAPPWRPLGLLAGAAVFVGWWLVSFAFLLRRPFAPSPECRAARGSR